MKCSDVERYLEAIVPAAAIPKGDNVGILVGRNDKNVSRILIAYRVDQSVAELAAAEKIDMILTHDPVISEPLLQVNGGSYQGRILLQLLRNDITCCCMGSRYDCSRYAAQDWIAEKLELAGVSVVEETGSYQRDGKNSSCGFGRIGHFKKARTIDEICRMLQESLGERSLRIAVQPEKRDLQITEVAVTEGLQNLEAAADKGAEVILTKGLTTADWVQISRKKQTVIEISDRPTEEAFLESMEQYLGEVLSSEVEIVTAEYRKLYEIVNI